ncbi:MAG: hypothetical protein RLZZ387_465 [Chloroflexota bacterium]|jgi:hypothetical protein
MARQRISLDGTWEFFPDPERRLEPHTLEQAGPPRSIRVPGPWQAQFDDMRDYSGVAWYRRTFDAPRPERGSGTAQLEAEGSRLQTHDSRLVTLVRFGAVDYHTTVWLNGQRIGEHEGGYLPFEFAIDDALRAEGPNELVVRVIDPGTGADSDEYPFAEIPHGKQSWYGPIGGIWQSVSLEVRPALHLTGLKVTPDVPGQRAHVTARLCASVERSARVDFVVTDPQGHVTRYQCSVAPDADMCEMTIPVPSPMLWDTRTPHLYRIEAILVAEHEAQLAVASDGHAALSVDNVPLDVLSANFGFRTIATSPDGHLMLNGRILYLRGALDQDYYPDLIYTPFSDEELEDQFAKAKHMGLNCLRTHIKITDPRYYDAADRAGLLIWTELPNWENLTEGAKRRATETIVGMIERDWNHPCIVIWTIINEGWGVDLFANADHRSWLSETYSFVKELDPTRLIVGNSPCFGNFHVVTDIEDFHNYYSIPDHYRKWRNWVQTFASRPSWTFAYDYQGVETWREYLRDPWSPNARTPAPEVRRRGNEPMVVSEFGNWGLPDVEQLRECYGGKEPWWFETGIEWGEGAVYPHGIEQRFKAYHMDKVFGTLSNLAAASQRMQFTALKYEIEQMRRHPNIVGYIITEFTDVHWEANGLLDQCRNPKAFHDVIGNVNSADAIVPDWERIVFWEGERCEVRLALSHFSPEDLRGGRLEWRVDLWPEVSGVFEPIDTQPATVSPVGTVVFEVPQLQSSARARLEMYLYDASGQEVTCNHLELYVFPRSVGRPNDGLSVYAPDLAEDLASLGYRVVEHLADADVAVAVALTDELLRHVQLGGRVLWLPDSAESLQTALGPLGIAQRRGRSWSGDWASNFNWIRQDKMFQAIPTGGTVDFAFADLTPDHVIVGLQPRDFADRVHAGLTVGWLHHTVALVAERRYGAGRLLICTFRLRELLRTNPVAQIMVGDMVAHLARNILVEAVAPVAID